LILQATANQLLQRTKVNKYIGEIFPFLIIEIVVNVNEKTAKLKGTASRDF
jgi:hypothetical protein